MTTTKTDMQAVLDAGTALAEVKVFDGSPFVIVPEGHEIKDLSKGLLKPARKSGCAKLADAASFIDYVSAERTDHTRLYGTVNPPQVQAVFNDHGGDAGWRDYRALYSFPLSVEWQTWKGADGKKMTQEEFAYFIEANTPDMVSPPAADMLEISQTLQAKKKVNFASGLRLDNGQNQLTYEEEVSGSAGAKGHLKIPELFTIGIPVFEGGERYGVEARLRYRIQEGGKLSMWFELVRPHKIIEDAVNQTLAAIEAGLDTKILRGTPA